MSFAQRLRSRSFPVTLEITPPQKPLPKVLLRRARLLGDAATAVNVIQRPGRQSSLDASLTLLEAGLEPVLHLVTRGRGEQEILAEVCSAAQAGVGAVLCIRGDHAAADSPGGPTIRTVIQRIRECAPGMAIGATMNQYAPDQAAALRNLRAKLAAGASFVQTQPAFDLESLRAAAEAIRASSPDVAIVAMVMPIVSPEAAEKIESRLGVRLPAGLWACLREGPAAAWACFEETVAALSQSGLVDGLAVMTFEMDPGPAVGERVVAALRGSAGSRSV